MTTMISPYRNRFQEIESKPHFPDWLNRTREAAYHNFLEHGFPTQEEEAWRYLNVKPLLEEGFDVAKPALADASKEILSSRLPGSPELIFVNGIYQEALSRESAGEKGLICPLTSAFRKNKKPLETLFPRNQKPFNAFSDINTFCFEEAAYLGLEKNVNLKEPVNILFLTTASGQHAFAYYPRMVVHLEAGAKASLLVQHVARHAPRFFNNAVLDIFLGEGSELELVNLFMGEEGGHYFGMVRAHLSSQSRFNYHALNEANGLVRQQLNVDFDGAGASCDLNSLAILEDKAESYQHVCVNHHVPDCKSRQLYKNILTGYSRAEFNGRVFVSKNAMRSDSGQLNRNLILSEEAKAFSRPQLQILTDDVQCTHGSATGQLEEEQVFYLNSRGLSRQKANAILTYGFAEEVLKRVTDEGVRKRLDASAIGKLMKIRF